MNSRIKGMLNDENEIFESTRKVLYENMIKGCGHMIYWDRLKPGRLTDVFQSKPRLKNFFHSHMSSLIQHPLAAQAVTQVYEASGDGDFLKDMLSKLKDADKPGLNDYVKGIQKRINSSID
ncbi:MAG: hypothetical protein WD426_18170 [Anditalea sp.]